MRAEAVADGPIRHSDRVGWILRRTRDSARSREVSTYL